MKGVYGRYNMFLCMDKFLYFILLKLKRCNCAIILRLFISKMLNKKIFRYLCYIFIYKKRFFTSSPREDSKSYK